VGLDGSKTFLGPFFVEFSRGLRFSGMLRSVDTHNITEEQRKWPRRVYVQVTDCNIKAIILKNVRMVRCTVHI